MGRAKERVPQDVWGMLAQAVEVAGERMEARQKMLPFMIDQLDLAGTL